jgi:hypothetical protein
MISVINHGDPLALCTYFQEIGLETHFTKPGLLFPWILKVPTYRNKV